MLTSDKARLQEVNLISKSLNTGVMPENTSKLKLIGDARDIIRSYKYYISDIRKYNLVLPI